MLMLNSCVFAYMVTIVNGFMNPSLGDGRFYVQGQKHLKAMKDGARVSRRAG